ncbi:MAG: hypothetical protein ACREK6_03785 [Candidatus Rokuibacteriota bacterium]
MRLGCGGCLTTLVVCGVIAGLVAGIGWTATGILAEPDLPKVPGGDEARALQKFTQVASGGRGRAGQAPEVIRFTEGELNALLTRRLGELAELPLGRAQLQVPGSGRVEVAARVPIAAILGEHPFNRLAGVLPLAWQQTPVWLRFRFNARIEPLDEGRRRYLRLDIDRFWLGRRRLPSALARLMLSPAALKLLHTRLPESIREVTIEAGRIDVTKGATP